MESLKNRSLFICATQQQCVDIFSSLAALVEKRRLVNIKVLENDLKLLFERAGAVKPLTSEQRAEIQKAQEVMQVFEVSAPQSST